MILQKLAPDGAVVDTLDTDSEKGQTLVAALIEYRRDCQKLELDPDVDPRVREYFAKRVKYCEDLLKFLIS